MRKWALTVRGRLVVLSGTPYFHDPLFLALRHVLLSRSVVEVDPSKHACGPDGELFFHDWAHPHVSPGAHCEHLSQTSVRAVFRGLLCFTLFFLLVVTLKIIFMSFYVGSFWYLLSLVDFLWFRAVVQLLIGVDFVWGVSDITSS